MTVTVLGAVFILIRCSQNDANPIGSTLFDSGDLGNVARHSISASSDTSFSVQPGSPGSGTYLYIGNMQDIQAASMIRFTGIEEPASIDSAILILNVSQIVNSADVPGFINIYTLTSSWDDLSFQPDDFSPDMIGSQIGFIEVTNDSTDSLRYKMDSSLIMEWMDSTSTIPNYGLYLETEDDLMIQCFSRDMSASVATGPQLLLFFQDDSTRYPETYEATYDIFLASSSLLPGDDYLVIESGTAFRTFLTFDLNSFAQHNIINQATLILTADTLKILPDITQTLYLTACYLDTLADLHKLECITENSSIGSYESGEARIDLTYQIQ